MEDTKTVKIPVSVVIPKGCKYFKRGGTVVFTMRDGDPADNIWWVSYHENEMPSHVTIDDMNYSKDIEIEALYKTLKGRK